MENYVSQLGTFAHRSAVVMSLMMYRLASTGAI